MKQVYGVPAILSFFFPGLGQLLKGQWPRALFVWGLYVVPATVWIVGTPELLPTVQFMPSNTAAVLLGSSAFPAVLLFSMAVWLWQTVDAYRRPAE